MNARSLALDIGGAHLKWAHQDGEAGTVAFALWQGPHLLSQALRELIEAHPCDAVLVTMTGELCDCFETKAEGVTRILNAVREAADQRRIHVWTTDGAFVSIDAGCEQTRKVAAANWHALATATARRLAPAEGVLIDVGSTTCDIIPFAEARCVARGATDAQRLATGELVYVGADRTPLMALADTVTWRGESIGVMAERFATMADVMVLCGLAPAQPRRTDTADGRPLTKEAAAARLLRMVGSDLNTHTVADAAALARRFLDAAIARMARGWHAVVGDGNAPARVVVSGSGAALAERLVRGSCPGAAVRWLSDMIGAAASAAACAEALLCVWGERCTTAKHTS